MMNSFLLTSMRMEKKTNRFLKLSANGTVLSQKYIKSFAIFGTKNSLYLSISTGTVTKTNHASEFVDILLEIL